MDVKTIKSVLNASGGPAQPCHFVVTVVPPIALLSAGFVTANDIRNMGSIAGGAAQVAFGGLSSLVGRQLSILAESAELPGRQFETTPHRIFATVRDMPYGLTYKNVMVTFICTNLMYERTFFDYWHQKIMNPSSQYMEYYENFVGSVVIQKLDNSNSFQSTAGEIFSTYVLEEAYPVSIQEQTLNAGEKDSYLKLTVEFSYARWKNTSEYFKDILGKTFGTSATFNDDGAVVTNLDLIGKIL